MQIRSLLLLAAASGVLEAQSPAPVTPQILTSAMADVELKPDRAALTFTVESRGATAARAGAETARKQRAVLDTLRALGISADQMQTVSIEITPEYVYPGENQPPKIAGYVARNSVRVDILKIDQTGILIDAGLSKEATGVGSLVFSSSKEGDARRQALEQAVGKAKAEAESMARAAGGILGSLIELSAQPFHQQSINRPMLFKSMAAAAPDVTPVSPGQIRVSANISAKWNFIAK
jgi:hypothetical protein